MKQRIGFVYDELYMYEEFNIKKMKSFIAPLYENWNEELFQQYVKKFDLPLKKKLKHFSKGMKMKCSLLFALAHEPEFIIMDEPTSGLDPIFRRELLDL
ncbi:ATP-binding cassette domain-containing protein, partial [Planococcus sp. SIMBA_143]